MVRKKYKHNTKSLRRYKKNELKKFVKDNNLPLKINYKMTKTEIVSALLKLQRNGYSDCFCKLEMKAPRKLSEKQQQNIRKLQERNQERLLKMKQVVKQEQKIDKVKPQPAQPIKVDERDTELEKVKNQPLMIEGESLFDLETLFNQANKMDETTMNNNLQWVENEIFGLADQAADTAIQDTIDFFEREFQQQEEQKEEPPQEPASLTDEKTEKLKDQLKQKTNEQLISLMVEQNIPRRSQYKNKTQRINAILQFVDEKYIREYFGFD